MSKLVSGVYLPSGTNVSPQETFVSDTESISELVGGTFDVIYTTCGNIPNLLFVGFVNDEGAINGSEYNYLATNLFKREVYGDVVIVWGLNADNKADGDIYDIPSDVLETLTENLEESTSVAYNLAAGMAGMCNYAIDNGIANEEEVMYHTLKINVDAQNGGAKESESRQFFLSMLDAIILRTEGAEEGSEDEAINQFCHIMKEQL